MSNPNATALSVDPLTLPASGIEAVYLMLVALAACSMGDFKNAHSVSLTRTIALVNFLFAVAYLALAANLWATHDDGNLFPGEANTNDGELLLRVFAFSRPVQFLDTLIIFYRCDKSRITVCHVLHNSTVLVLWALVLDNPTALGDAGFRLIAAVHASVLSFYHTYFVFTTYGKCAYPCSYGLTATLVGAHLVVLVLASTVTKQAYDDEDDARMAVGVVWAAYSLLMVMLTAPFMWKKRLNMCCPSQHTNTTHRTVGELV